MLLKQVLYLYFLIGLNKSAKSPKMKKIILLSLITLVTVIAFTSCGASRRGTGCPMTEGIIH